MISNLEFFTQANYRLNRRAEYRLFHTQSLNVTSHAQPFSRSYWKICSSHSGNTYFTQYLQRGSGVNSDSETLITDLVTEIES